MDAPSDGLAVTQSSSIDAAAPTLDEPAQHEDYLPEDDAAEGIIDDDGEDEDVEEPRPRHSGKARQWLRHNSAEIGLAASLDQIEGSDLAIHLYNAHCAKRRLVDDGEDHARNVKPYFRKERWRAAEQSKEWAPNHSWTAWPLRQEDMPREDERVRLLRHSGRPGAGVAGRTKAKEHSSTRLEDVLLGEILKQSRQQFYARQEEARQAALQEEDADHDTRGQDGTLRAAIMTDEDEAMALAKPVIRHIITKLETLLTALHRSRKGHARPDTSEPATDTEPSSGAESTSKSRSRSRSGRSQTRSRSRTPSRFLPGRSNRRPRPRDWSEVLSLAAMTGWDTDIVQRTAERCSSLFGESFDLAFLSETPGTGIRPLDVPSRPPSAPPTPEQEAIPLDYEITGLDFRCPYPTCYRHHDPYAVRWRLNEHMKRTHKHVSRSRSRPRDELPNEEMEGGVHVDGFMRPVVLPAGYYGKERRRATRRTKGVYQKRVRRERVEGLPDGPASQEEVDIIEEARGSSDQENDTDDSGSKGRASGGSSIASAIRWRSSSARSASGTAEASGTTVPKFEAADLGDEQCFLPRDDAMSTASE